MKKIHPVSGIDEEPADEAPQKEKENQTKKRVIVSRHNQPTELNNALERAKLRPNSESDRNKHKLSQLHICAGKFKIKTHYCIGEKTGEMDF